MFLFPEETLFRHTGRQDPVPARLLMPCQWACRREPQIQRFNGRVRLLPKRSGSPITPARREPRPPGHGIRTAKGKAPSRRRTPKGVERKRGMPFGFPLPLYSYTQDDPLSFFFGPPHSLGKEGPEEGHQVRLLLETDGRDFGQPHEAVLQGRRIGLAPRRKEWGRVIKNKLT
jgi:hypothetical protein